MNMQKHEVRAEYVPKPGVHCTSSALRNVIDHLGYPLSEAMVFGLGAGMGLAYLSIWGMPHPMLGGRNLNFEVNLLDNLGVKYNIYTSRNKEEGWARLKDRLDRNLPSAINVEMHYCDYLNPPDELVFGMHTIVAANYDNEYVYLSDTALEGLQILKLERFHLARSATLDRAMPPKNQIYEFDNLPETMDMEEMIRKAIMTQADALQYSSWLKSILGITGGFSAIDKFLKHLPRWKKLDENEFYHRKHWFKGNISDNGTGGGLFRTLYSQFLAESHQITDIPGLDASAKQYAELGKTWDELGLMILDLDYSRFIDDPDSEIEEISNLVPKISSMEKNAAQELAKIIT